MAGTRAIAAAVGGAFFVAACAAPRASEGRSAIALGARTSAPTEEIARELELPSRVRVQGRVVNELVAGGAAARAGVRAGDVILRIDELELFSQDDLDDWLRTQRVGERVALDLVRGDTRRRETVSTTLDPLDIPPNPFAVRWEFASLVSLSRAQTGAYGQSTKVLVGLSGAET